MATGKELKQLRSDDRQVKCVAFSPDSRRALSAGVYGPVHLWDLASGKEVCRMEGHTMGVNSVAFSPDGRRAVSGSDDKTVRLWQLPELGVTGGTPSNTAETPTRGPVVKPPVPPVGGTGGLSTSAPGSPSRAVDVISPVPHAVTVDPVKPIPPGPFRVATNGLAGRQFIDPISFRPDGLGFTEPGTAVPWATKDAFARLTTKAALVYPRLPISRYVCEVELTIHKRGQMTFYLGDPWHASALNFIWNPKREITECLLQEVKYGGWGWNGSHDFAPERRISLKVVVGDGRQALFHDNKRIVPFTAQWIFPTDCCLRIRSETPDSALIHRCSLRPLTEQDVAACGWTTPPTEVPFKAGEAAARLAKISEGYPAKPKAGEHFALKTTGTPMAWIPPGEFEMGSRNPKDEGRHRVRLTRGYWMAQVEVTQGEYRKVTGANPSRVTGSPYLPVDWVAWDQAAAYCRKLTNLERKAKQVASQVRVPPADRSRVGICLSRRLG